MDINVYFFSQKKKKRYSRFDVETKLTHDFYIFFISVKFPANIHFLQSTSNYIIRENVSKKKKKTNEIAFKKANLRVSNSYLKIFYHFILF